MKLHRMAGVVLLFLCVCVPLWAQSFQQVVVTNGDTTVVYGKYVTVTQTTVTVDSVYHYRRQW